MFFRLAAFPNRPDLVGIVGVDGVVYWRAVDLAKFLGYANPFIFAKTYATKTVKDILPVQYFANIPAPNEKKGIRLLDTKIVTFQEMIHLMSSKYHQFNSHTMMDLWQNANIVKPTEVIITDSCYNDSPRLIVLQDYYNPTTATTTANTDEATEILKLQEWLMEFTASVLEFYKNLVDPPPPSTEITQESPSSPDMVPLEDMHELSSSSEEEEEEEETETTTSAAHNSVVETPVLEMSLTHCLPYQIILKHDGKCYTYQLQQ